LLHTKSRLVAKQGGFFVGLLCASRSVTVTFSPFVVLNLFQDTALPSHVILKQVQDDERQNDKVDGSVGTFTTLIPTP
jgi:hypothetical protein